MGRKLLTVLLVLACALLVAGQKKGTVQTEKKPMPKSSIELKEKPAGIGGLVYLYVSEKTPKYIIDAMRERRIEPAIDFTAGNAPWIREILPKLKGSQPLVFVHGALTDMDRSRLHELAKFFDFAITLIHVSGNPKEDLELSIKPAASYRIQKSAGKESVALTITKKGGKFKPEQAKLLSVLDEKDLREPLWVAQGIVFEKSRIALINIDNNSAAAFAAERDLTVIFSENEKNIAAFIEKR